MAVFGKRLRELRSERQILQAAFAETCGISAAYLSDIERGKRNPPGDKVILEWAAALDPGQAEQIGPELVALAARDRDRAEAVTEDVTEAAGSIWESSTVPARIRGGKSDTPFLDHFAVDLVQLVELGRCDPAPARERELAEIAAVLACRRRNSVVITAQRGAQIHQLVQGLAWAMSAGRVPGPLAGLRLLRLDGLQAGVKYRGQLEERVRVLVDETTRLGNVLLAFHSLGDVVDLEKALNGAILGPAMEAGAMRILTGALRGELDHCLKVNPRLVDCLRPVVVRDLDRDAVLRGLYELRERYAEHHGVTYTDASLVAMVDRAEDGDAAGLWQRSLDLLDEAGARVRLQEGGAEVTVDDVDACGPQSSSERRPSSREG